MPDDPKQELKKLGTGQEVDMAKLYEEMEEDRMDRMIETLRSQKPSGTTPGNTPPSGGTPGHSS